MRWTVIVPLKALPSAKSRLAVELDATQHADLVTAIRADTLAAVRAASRVARLVVVSDQPDPALTADHVVIQQAPGLNAALAEAADDAARRWPRDGIAALVGDLPALSADDLDYALLAAEQAPRSFVPDASGVGTTLLAIRPGETLAPAFGAGSAARHGERAVALEARDGLRTDVDTLDELRIAAGVGVGAHTARALAGLGLASH